MHPLSAAPHVCTAALDDDGRMAHRTDVDPKGMTVCALTAVDQAVPGTRQVRGRAPAEVLELMTDWHHGYPQPEREMAYRSLTYDDSDYCQECGGGLRQVAPSRMSGEPRWGRRAILQLNWVFDEFFVRPEFHAEVFAPHGIAARPVLDKRGERALETVVQLDVPDEVPVDTTDLVGESCPTCGRLRYLPHVRGPLPAPLKPLPAAMVRTVEVLGSGAVSDRRMLVTANLWADLDAAGRLGVSPRPAGSLD